jgi:hypothetical protein
MGWTSPSTRVTGELITAAIWNSDITDNLSYLNIRPSDTSLINEASDYTTTSTSFVDIDATDMAVTITTNGGDVLVVFNADLNIGTGGITLWAYFDITIDGTRQGNDDGLRVYSCNDGTDIGMVSIVYLATGLSAGSHTFKVQWKKKGTGTLTLYAGAGTTSYDVHPFLFAKEV